MDPNVQHLGLLIYFIFYALAYKPVCASGVYFIFWLMLEYYA